MATRAIFGLGNPGPRYAATRHNAGFMVLDALALRSGITFDRKHAGALCGEGRIADLEVRLAKPMEFMNRSGRAVRELLPEQADLARDLLVVHDELDLPFGRLKLKLGGGTAGHRGLASIHEELAEPGFARLRFGVGRPPEGQDVADFVLAPFSTEEVARLPALIEEAAAACLAWLELGIGPAMNRVNAGPRSAEAEPGGGTGAPPSP